MSPQAAAVAPAQERALLRELAALDALLRRKARSAGLLAAELDRVRLTSAGSARRPAAQRELDALALELAGLEERIAARRRRRLEVVSATPLDLLELYAIAEARGQSPPVVSLVGAHACGGCFLRIEPRLVVAMHRRGFVACSHCARIVFAADTAVAV